MNKLLKKFVELMPENVDGCIIFSEENRRYFTGFPSSDGVLIASKNGCVYFEDGRYIEAAQSEVTACEVRLLKRLDLQLPEIIEELKIKTLAVEVSKISLERFLFLQKICKDTEVVSSDECEKIIIKMRSEKTKTELQKMKKAQAIAEQGFEYILKEISTEKTERELALMLDFFMMKNGAEAPAFETILISGAATSKPHGVPSDEKVKNGFITMDFGAQIDGYKSDMTRTVAIGSLSSKQIEVYETVLKAQSAALKKAGKNVKCSDVDFAARKVIEDAGYGEYFTHANGHSVGLEIHESPNCSPRSTAVLNVGNIMTVEPGIYIPENFGVRIEDMIYITENGIENLTHAPKELIIL